MEIKDLELTESDFDLLVEGLDTLPEKGAMGEVMGVLFDGLLGDKLDRQSPAYIEMQQKKEKESRIKKQKADARKDEIAILKGKMILLKRWLITQGAVKQTNDIIGND